MPDLGVSYTLTGPSQTTVFNDGSADQYLVSSILGLVQPPVRAPQDDVPFGDGALWYNWWKGGRHITFDGIFLITSERWGDPNIVIRNSMEEDLRVALEEISGAESATGALVWQPQGQPVRTLEVRCDVALECPEDSGYLFRQFHFSLMAAAPDWVEST